MKRLHKKISVGVLVSGLLIGGVSFSNRSVSHASSNNNNSSVFVDIKDFLNELKVPLPKELQIFLKDGFRGILDEDYRESKLPSLVEKIEDIHKKELYNSVRGLGVSGNYAVLGFELGGIKYSINKDYDKYWSDSNLINLEYKSFVDAARKRFNKKGEDKFRKLNLESNYIYRLEIKENNDRYRFLIAVFENEENK